MDDLISRQAAIDAVQQHREGVLGSYEYDEGVAFVYAAAHNHIIEVIERLPSAQRWIPCSERLPNVNGDYLVTFKYLIFYPVEVCEFKDGKWESGMYDVVAWQFIPEPYREDGDNDADG